VTEDRNFQTNPQCKITRIFPNKFMKDEYNRADLRERQLRKKSAKARIGGVFKNMDHGSKEFNKIKQVFGCDVKLPDKKVPKS
jgi:hypothetical protein